MHWHLAYVSPCVFSYFYVKTFSKIDHHWIHCSCGSGFAKVRQVFELSDPSRRGHLTKARLATIGYR